MKKIILLFTLAFPLVTLAWPNPPITVRCYDGSVLTFDRSPIRDRDNNKYYLESSGVRGEFIVIKNSDVAHSLSCDNVDPNPPPQKMDDSRHGGNYYFQASPSDYFFYDTRGCKSMAGCICHSGKRVPMFRTCR
jgi:hypothetical protein